MANAPQDDRNRKGCFLTIAVVALFVVIYLLVGLNAKSKNEISTNIETVPASQR